MQEHDNTTNTCACIRAIANSSPEKAIINNKGSAPKTKNSTPELIILYVNPLKMFNNMCQLSTFAANLSPSEIFLARQEMNSINTSNGNRAKGQPEGTNKEKNFRPCKLKPKIVAPKTTVKLNEKVKTKWLVLAKL